MAEKRISLNYATAEELTQLPGIGPALAGRIVTYRDTVRPFEEPSQITAVSGIGDQTYRAMADHLVVGVPEEPPGPEGRASQEGIEQGEEASAKLATEEKAPAEAAALFEEAIIPEEHVEPEVEGLLSREGMLEEERPLAEETPEEAAQMPPEEGRGPGEREEEASREGWDAPEAIMGEAPSGAEEVFAEEGALPEVEEGTALEVEEGALPEVEEGTALEVEEEVAPEVEEEVAPEVDEEAALEGEGEPAGERLEPEAVPSETQPPPLPVEERPERTPARSWWRRLSWLWIALLGGLLGMAFTLVVFSGVNGSLDVAHSRAVVDVKGRMGTMATDINSLQGDVQGLQKRLDALEELTVRMERIEAGVGDLQEATADLGERADALEERIAAVVQDLETVSEQMATLEDQAEQTRGFFRGLQTLLNDVFGAVEAESMVTPTPTPEGK